MAALGQLTVLTAPTRSFHCEARGVSGLRGRGMKWCQKRSAVISFRKKRRAIFIFVLFCLYFDLDIFYLQQYLNVFIYIHIYSAIENRRPN